MIYQAVKQIPEKDLWPFLLKHLDLITNHNLLKSLPPKLPYFELIETHIIYRRFINELDIKDKLSFKPKICPHTNRPIKNLTIPQEFINTIQYLFDKTPDPSLLRSILHLEWITNKPLFKSNYEKAKLNAEVIYQFLTPYKFLNENPNTITNFMPIILKRWLYKDALDYYHLKRHRNAIEDLILLIKADDLEEILSVL